MEAIPWMDDIAGWFADPANALRFVKVMGYTGCRELWLQAELAMWLEKRERLAADGDWDTNLYIPKHGRSDLGIRGAQGALAMALEIKVLGGAYQPKVLTGSAGTLRSFVDKLRVQAWQVDEAELAQYDGFCLLADYQRLRRLDNTQVKLLLLVVDNRTVTVPDLGDALAEIQFPAQRTRRQEIVPGLTARLWQL